MVNLPAKMDLVHWTFKDKIKWMTREKMDICVHCTLDILGNFVQIIHQRYGMLVVSLNQTNEWGSEWVVEWVVEWMSEWSMGGWESEWMVCLKTQAVATQPQWPCHDPLDMWHQRQRRNTLSFQGLPFPTARWPGASKTTSRASGFGQIFLLYFI